MKTETLHALLIDRELGELTPEAAELLEAWLEEHPNSAASAQSTRQTLNTMGATVRKFPELVRPDSVRPEKKWLPNLIHFPGLPIRWMPLAWAAAILFLVGTAGWMGFRAGLGYAQTANAPAQR